MTDSFEQVGQKIRELRLARNLSLRGLAERAGCSAGFLSTLEQDRSSPTVNMLARICEALGTNVSDFLKPPAKLESPLVIRAGEPLGPLAKSWAGAELVSLFPEDLRNQFTALTLDLKPGSHTLPLRAARISIKEMAVVLYGSVRLELMSASFILHVRDIIYFDLKHPHAWHHQGTRPARVLLINPHAFHLIEEATPQSSPGNQRAA